MQPISTLYLSAELKEISALSFHEPSRRLVALNDEKGVYYFISPKSGIILDSESFGCDGDFEGVEWLEDRIYVLRSDRQLLSIEPKSQTISILLPKKKGKSEYEGLCYDPSRQCLLIARKRGEKKDKPLWVYSFNLHQSTDKTNKEFSIDLDQIVSSYTKRKSLSDKKKKRYRSFAPSGIAVHPKNFDIYILSAQGEVLLVLSSEGNFKDMVFLPSKLLPQPEGICFDNNGLLYIASEGQKQEGRIAIFNEF